MVGTTPVLTTKPKHSPAYSRAAFISIPLA